MLTFKLDKAKTQFKTSCIMYPVHVYKALLSLLQGHWFSYQRTPNTKVSLLLYFIHKSAFYEFQIKSAYG